MNGTLDLRKDHSPVIRSKKISAWRNITATGVKKGFRSPHLYPWSQFTTILSSFRIPSSSTLIIQQHFLVAEPITLHRKKKHAKKKSKQRVLQPGSASIRWKYFPHISISYSQPPRFQNHPSRAQSSQKHVALRSWICGKGKKNYATITCGGRPGFQRFAAPLELPMPIRHYLRFKSHLKVHALKKKPVLSQSSILLFR